MKRDSVNENPFYCWLLEPGHRVRRVGTMVSPLVASFASAYLKRLFENGQSIDWIPSFISGNQLVVGDLVNLLVVSALLMVLLRTPAIPRPEDKWKSARRKVNEFYGYWKFFWVLFFAYYATKVFFDFGSHSYSQIAQCISFINDACIVLCYLRLSDINRGDKYHYLILVLPLTLVVALVFIALESMGPKSALQAQISSAFLLGLGACEAVILSLFIGKLDSRAINPPSAIVALMYLYAALQVFYKAFELDGNVWRLTGSEAPGVVRNIAFDVLLLVALLKGVLFILVYWMRASGGLLFFVYWMEKHLSPGPASKTIDNERDEFLAEVSASRFQPSTR